MEPVAEGLTYDDLERLWHEEDPRRHELIDGALYVSPVPLLRHQAVVMALAATLFSYKERHGGAVYAGAGVFFNERNYVIPDVVALSAATHALVTDPRFVHHPPDLVVEVLSPSTRGYDLVKKRAVYEARGIAELWFVDLVVDEIEVLRLAGGRYADREVVGRGGRIESTALPGFVLDVTWALNADDPGGNPRP